MPGWFFSIMWIAFFILWVLFMLWVLAVGGLIICLLFTPIPWDARLRSLYIRRWQFRFAVWWLGIPDPDTHDKLRREAREIYRINYVKGNDGRDKF